MNYALKTKLILISFQHLLGPKEEQDRAIWKAQDWKLKQDIRVQKEKQWGVILMYG